MEKAGLAVFNGFARSKIACDVFIFFAIVDMMITVLRSTEESIKRNYLYKDRIGHLTLSSYSPI